MDYIYENLPDPIPFIFIDMGSFMDRFMSFRILPIILSIEPIYPNGSVKKGSLAKGSPPPNGFCIIAPII